MNAMRTIARGRGDIFMWNWFAMSGVVSTVTIHPPCNEPSNKAFVDSRFTNSIHVTVVWWWQSPMPPQAWSQLIRYEELLLAMRLLRSLTINRLAKV